MTALLEGHGFAVREAKGLALMDQSVREGRFIAREVIGRDRLYDDIEDCFLDGPRTVRGGDLDRP